MTPQDAIVRAPEDGEVAFVFDTKHAIGFMTDSGISLLIHIGIDTVNLNGEHFTAHVKDGDTVKQGQLLVEFEKDQIEKAGYATAIPHDFHRFARRKEAGAICAW